MSLTVSNGVVYIGAEDSSSIFVDALNATSGAQLWSYQTKGSYLSSLTVSNGVVYVSASTSNTSVFVDALNASSGAQLWSYQMGGFFFSSLNVSTDRVCIETDGKTYASVSVGGRI